MNYYVAKKCTRNYLTHISELKIITAQESLSPALLYPLLLKTKAKQSILIKNLCKNVKYVNCWYVLCELNSTTQLLTSYIDTHPTVLLTVPCTNVPVYSVQFCFTRVVLFVVTCIGACVETVSHISRL